MTDIMLIKILDPHQEDPDPLLHKDQHHQKDQVFQDQMPLEEAHCTSFDLSLLNLL